MATGQQPRTPKPSRCCGRLGMTCWAWIVQAEFADILVWRGDLVTATPLLEAALDHLRLIGADWWVLKSEQRLAATRRCGRGMFHSRPAAIPRTSTWRESSRTRRNPRCSGWAGGSGTGAASDRTGGTVAWSGRGGARACWRRPHRWQHPRRTNRVSHPCRRDPQRSSEPGRLVGRSRWRRQWLRP